MIRRYLEDIGVGIFQTIDLKEESNTLAFLVTRMCAFPVYGGVGKLAGTDAIEATSDHFTKIFSNLEWLAEELRSVNRKDVLRTKFTREFHPYPRFDLRKLKAALTKNDDKGNKVLPEGMETYVQGGHVLFSASGVLYKAKAGSMYVTLGYKLDVEKGRKKPPTRICFYTSISLWGKQCVWDEQSETKYLSHFSEKKSLVLLGEHLAIARKKACQNAEGKYLSKLKELRLPG